MQTRPGNGSYINTLLWIFQLYNFLVSKQFQWPSNIIITKIINKYTRNIVDLLLY